MNELLCFKCQRANPLSSTSPLGRNDSCLGCGSDLRVCKNCQHYDPSSQWECRERISENIREKERGNFCDFFRARYWSSASNSAQVTTSEDLRKKAEALFKKF